MASVLESATAFAPASVSNVACGFDVLGFALEAPGDRVTARLGSPGVRICEITGDAGRLPRDASKNTAGVAARALLDLVGERRGLELTIDKGLPLSSGLGGSAASAVAAVVAVDALLGTRLPIERLFDCAIRGEYLESAALPHGDNIAPCLYGGFVLVRQVTPGDVVRLPVPPDLMAVVVHPELEIQTAGARALLGNTVPLADAIRQWANLGAFVHAMHTADYALLSRALEDVIAEPKRASLVPGFADIKRAAVGAGALGCSLSGSGPSLFALCRGRAAADRVAAAMIDAATVKVGGSPHLYVSPVAPAGARVVATVPGSCAS